MALYHIVMTYPNGKVEEIQENFSAFDQAREYAENLVQQVGYNASIKGSFDNSLFVKTYYLITAKKDGQTMIVFDSRKK